MNKQIFAPYAPRCGAHARTTGKPCKKAAMANGRCRNHGGRSPKGKDSPRYKHGFRTKEVIDMCREAREFEKTVRDLLDR